MKANEVLTLACEYLRDYQLRDVLEQNTLDSASDVQKSKVKLLTTSLNDVVQTLALMYFPLLKTENMKSNTGKYNYSDFENVVLEVVKVKDNLGNKIQFKCYPESVDVGVNEIVLTYHYQPKFVVELDDVLDISNERVGIRMLVTGVLSRYYMYQGMYQESMAWERAFTSTIMAAKATNRSQVMPKRSWY